MTFFASQGTRTIGELENNTIVTRTTAGREKYRASMPAAVSPLGYTSDGKRGLAADEEGPETVRYIFQMRRERSWFAVGHQGPQRRRNSYQWAASGMPALRYDVLLPGEYEVIIDRVDFPVPAS